jgi:hypothetical protein
VALVHDLARPVAVLGHSSVVERGLAMPYVMHRFAEALVVGEQGMASTVDTTETPHPCRLELDHSATPFGARYTDFSELDIRQEHQDARRRRAYQLYEDEFWDVTSRAEVNRMSYEQHVGVPSGYPLAVMTNFLTSTAAIPLFSDALKRLMRRSLVPGGVILVLGGTDRQYPLIYRELDNRAQAAGLRVVPGFDNPLQAGNDERELQLIRDLTRSTWRKLEDHAGHAEVIRQQLRSRGAADIFDDTIPFTLPRFMVRVYRRGRWPQAPGLRPALNSART